VEGIHDKGRRRKEKAQDRERPRSRSPVPTSGNGGVLADLVQNAPQIDEAGPVQSQRRHRGASRGGQPKYQRVIVAPGEVTQPSLPPRVIEGNELTADRIEPLRL
jgi:hypothetical protein